MQRAFALYAALVDNRYPVSKEVIEQRIYRDDATEAVEGKSKNRTIQQRKEWFETTFKRDQALLRDLGIQIKFIDDARGSGYLIDPTKSFARGDVLFELDEATCALIYLALTSMVNEPLFALPHDIRLALLRLSPLFESLYGVDKIIASSNRSLDEHADVQARYAELILRAILDTRRLELVYRNLAGQQRQRVLSPYGLSFFEGRWYVIGHDSHNDAQRCFALSRIQDAKLLNETFDYPRDFTTGDHITLPFALNKKKRGHGDVGDYHTAKLMIDESQTAQVEAITRGFGSVTPQKDGSLVWTIEYDDLARLIRFALAHQLTFADGGSIEARYLADRLDEVIEAHSPATTV